MKTTFNLYKSKLALLMLLPAIAYCVPGNDKLPLIDSLGKQSTQKTIFIENKGQIHDQNNNSRPDVLFGGTDGSMVYHLKNNGISYQLRRIDSWKNKKSPVKVMNKKEKTHLVPDKTTFYRLDINWLNVKTNASIIKGEEQLGYSTHYLSNCSDGGIEVKSYGTVTYQNIYTGIDLKWYQKDGHLKYDYLVSAGADYKKIQLELKGAEHIQVNSKGDLVIQTPLGEIIEQAPSVVQDGNKLKSKWLVKMFSGRTILSFDIENLTRDRAFVIDPAVRVWGTYYGGVGDEGGNACATDASGNVFLAGYTDSNAGPNIATLGSHQTSMSGTYYDTFLVKFNSNGVRQWGTYYGGSGDDEGFSCTTDMAGNVYVAGFTDSNIGTAIATPGSHQAAYGGGAFDALLVKFNSAGVRQWGTYYGGTGEDVGYSCAVDFMGNIYLAGNTDSNSGGTVMSTFGSHQPSYSGGLADGFLVKFNSTTGVRQWGTYYGGTGYEMMTCSIDVIGNVFIAGYTGTNDTGTIIATPGTHQASHGGGLGDGFLAKFNTGGVRQWGTYYGGTGDDGAFNCSVEATGEIYLSGYTDSNNGTSIASLGSHQATYGGGIIDDFLVRFDANGLRLWGTYYGGSGDEQGSRCAIDLFGNVYIAGTTDSNTGIATIGSHQPTSGGGWDGILVKFNSAGVREWGTYYGGAQADNGFYCAADPSGGVYLCGVSSLATGASIATASSHQALHAGSTDAYLVKFQACSTPSMPASISGPTLTCAGAGLYVINPIASATSYLWILPNGWSGTSTTNSINVSMGLTGTLSVAASNSCGAGPSQSLTVIVNALPTLSITPTKTVICKGEATNINVTGADFYSWGTIGSGSNITVSPTITTTYTVTGTNTNSCVNMASVTMSVNACLGISDIFSNVLATRVFPNPNEGAFTVKINTLSENMEIEIYNSIGRLISTQNIEHLETYINLNTQPSGVYIVRIKENKKALSNSKLIIK